MNASAQSPKLLSILCQGRNDAYMGNFKWRLATAINSHIRNFNTLGVLDQVELIVTDWGSEVPLYQELELSQLARKHVRFLLVSQELAASYQKDSSFSGVHPINACARRANGTYLMYSDSDVILPLKSLEKLLAGLQLEQLESYSLKDTFFIASKYHIPVEIVAQNLSMEELDCYITKNFDHLHREVIDPNNYKGGGACLLMHRDLWHESRGWDERLIYWGWYDIDWHIRLNWKYRWSLLENLGIQALHLEHYRGRFIEGSRETQQKQKSNPTVYPRLFAPNSSNWGLGKESLPIVDGYGVEVQTSEYRPEAPSEKLVPIVQCSSSESQPLKQLRIVPHVDSKVRQLIRCLDHKSTLFVCSDTPSTQSLELAKQFDTPDLTIGCIAKMKQAINSDLKYLQNQLHQIHSIKYLCGTREEISQTCRHHHKRFELIVIDVQDNLLGATGEAKYWLDLLYQSGSLICLSKPSNFGSSAVSLDTRKAAHHSNYSLFEIPGLWGLLSASNAAAANSVLSTMITEQLEAR